MYVKLNYPFTLLSLVKNFHFRRLHKKVLYTHKYRKKEFLRKHALHQGSGIEMTIKPWNLCAGSVLEYN